MVGLTVRQLHFFLYFPKTYEICWAINARELSTLITSVITSFQSMFTIRIILFHYQTAPEGAAVIYVNIQLQLLSYTFFELHHMSMGHALLVCTKFYFFTPSERFESHRLPSLSNGSLLQFISTLSLTMVPLVEDKLMYFGYMYAPNLTQQGESVIIEISPANGYRNPASPNIYFTHGIKNAFPKRINYTIGYKINMHSECKGIACTCVGRKCRKREHAPNARLWTQKDAHTLEWCINDSGRPPTHFWFNSQVDLTPKYELNPSRGMVKDLKGPLFTLKGALHFQESICIVMLPLFSCKEHLSSLEHISIISLGHSYHLLSE
jgi:hypothetical protein